MRWPIAAVMLAAPIAAAADWPQWLGPTRDGAVPEKVAPWTGDLKSDWRIPAGESHSSPVVAGGLVYLHTKVAGKEAEQVQAFNAKTGEVVWHKEYEKPAFTTPFGNGPRATPSIADGKLYTFGITGVLACWDAKTGDPIWKTDTLIDAKRDNLFFGLSASPLVVGDLVIVQGGGTRRKSKDPKDNDATKHSKGIKAFDRKTGKPVWTAAPDDPASYAAPALFGEDIVVLTGAHLLAVSAKGEVKWKVPFKDSLNESSTTPIKHGDLFIAASVTAGAVAVKPDGGEAKKAWENKGLNCYFSTPVPAGDKHLYMITGGLSINPAVTLRCVEAATGKEIWKKEKVGKYHAALYRLADGNLLMHDDASGDLRLLAPNVEKYEELAKSKASGSSWCHPAIADGKIYLKDNKELICLSLSTK